MQTFQLELGDVSDQVTVPDHIIRFVPGPTSEIDGEDLSGYEAQEHLKNTSNSKLEKVQLDVSYFDSSGKFLGLNKTSGLFDDDDMDRGETKAFLIVLEIPGGTARCILNVQARRKTFLSWFF